MTGEGYVTLRSIVDEYRLFRYGDVICKSEIEGFRLGTTSGCLSGVKMLLKSEINEIAPG